MSPHPSVSRFSPSSVFFDLRRDTSPTARKGRPDSQPRACSSGELKPEATSYREVVTCQTEQLRSKVIDIEARATHTKPAGKEALSSQKGHSPRLVDVFDDDVAQLELQAVGDQVSSIVAGVGARGWHRRRRALGQVLRGGGYRRQQGVLHRGPLPTAERHPSHGQTRHGYDTVTVCTVQYTADSCYMIGCAAPAWTQLLS